MFHPLPIKTILISPSVTKPAATTTKSKKKTSEWDDLTDTVDHSDIIKDINDAIEKFKKDKEFKPESNDLSIAMGHLIKSFKQYHYIISKPIMNFIGLVCGSVGDVKTNEFIERESLIKTYPYGFIVSDSDKRNQVTLPIVKEYESLLNTLNNVSSNNTETFSPYGKKKGPKIGARITGPIEERDKRDLDDEGNSGCNLKNPIIYGVSDPVKRIEQIADLIEGFRRNVTSQTPIYAYKSSEFLCDKLEKIEKKLRECVNEVYGTEEVQTIDEKTELIGMSILDSKDGVMYERITRMSDDHENQNVCLDKDCAESLRKFHAATKETVVYRINIYDRYKSAIEAIDSISDKISDIDKEEGLLIGDKVTLNNIINKMNTKILKKSKEDNRVITVSALNDIKKTFSAKLNPILTGMYNSYVLNEAREYVKSNPLVLGDAMLKDCIKSPIVHCHNMVCRISRVFPLPKIEELAVLRDDDKVDDTYLVVCAFARLVSAYMRATSNVSKAGHSKQYISSTGQNALFRDYRMILLDFRCLSRHEGKLVFRNSKSAEEKRNVLHANSNYQETMEKFLDIFK